MANPGGFFPSAPVRSVRAYLCVAASAVIGASALACAGAAELAATVTATPAAATATASASAAPEPTTAAFRTLTLQASLTPPVVAAGSTFEVRTDNGGSGLPQYTLSIDGNSFSTVRYDGTLVWDTPLDNVKVMEWQAGPNYAKWVLQAVSPGNYMINIYVTGEVGASSGGPYYFTHGAQKFQLTVMGPG